MFLERQSVVCEYRITQHVAWKVLLAVRASKRAAKGVVYYSGAIV